ncbi:MAG: hypothetical protein ABR962_06935 [Candidatus Bathyarchaeia archaeon]|jgi:hypothetical protein
MTLRKLVLFSMLIALLGIGIVYAVEYEFKPSFFPPSPTIAQGVNESEGLGLTMTLQKTNYGLGEPINTTLTITNVSNQTNTFTLGPYKDFDFQVYNDTHIYNGTNGVIYQYSDFWVGKAIPYIETLETLEPGESLSENLVWMQTYPVPIGGSEGVPVSPGTYYIVGLIGSVLSTTNPTIETTPIRITIT